MGEGVLVRSWCLSVCAKVARLLQKYDLRSQSIEFRQQFYSPHEEGGSGLGSEALPAAMLLRITQAAQPSRLGCAATRAGNPGGISGILPPAISSCRHFLHRSRGTSST